MRVSHPNCEHDKCTPSLAYPDTDLWIAGIRANQPTNQEPMNVTRLAGTLDPDEMRRGTDDDAVVRDRRGRKRPFIERILADHLEVRACGDDEGVTVLAERKDLAVVGPRRCREAAHVGRNPLASVDFPASLGVVCR